ncbi:MAG: hypothetical protein VX938_08370, partial [Myxococcota bacterium]|nr:hypothetical protein [Myxococcota bacterium]
EISGIVASRTREDVLWGHDDSGADARLVALNLSAQPVHQLMLPGVEHVDWEDIAAAPCPTDGAPCLWVADIGDNLAARDSVQVHVVAEPDLAPDDDGPGATSDAEVRGTVELTYPDGPMDMESLVVDGGGEILWLFEKVDGPTARIYRGVVPAGITGEVALAEVGSFPSPGDDVTYGRMITGADLHSSGTRLLLRLYTGTWEYPLNQPEEIASLGDITPTLAASGPFPEELQGEAVAYDASGTGFWTISEDLGGVGGQPLHHYDCQAPQGGP